MPQYFSGADPSNAFAAGMMAGYEFVDRIQARREQLRLQKRAEERDDARFGMEQTAFKQRTELTDLQMTDLRADIADEEKVRKHRDERQPIEEAKQDVLYGQQVEAAGLGIAAAREQAADRAGLKRGRAAYASLTESRLRGDEAEGQERQRLSDIAAKQQPAAKPAPAAAPAPPVDLRTEQKKLDENTLGSRFKRGIQEIKEESARLKEAAETRSVATDWAILARPARFGSGMATIGGKPVDADAFRRGTAAADLGAQYLKDRDKVEEVDRPALDTTVYNASVERHDAITAEIQKLSTDPKNAPQVRALQSQRGELKRNIDALAKAKTKSVLKDNNLPKVVDGADEAVVNALLQPARMQEQSGVTPELSQSQLRLLETRLGRIDNPRKLNKQEAEWLSEAFRTGYINETTYWNWHKYGGPAAPGKPEITKFNDEYGLMVTPGGGMAWVKAPGAGSENTNKKRESADKLLSMIGEQFESHIVAGTLGDADKGSGKVYAGRLIEAVRAHATELQKKMNIQLLDGNGKVTFEHLDALDWTDLINIYVNNKAGMDDPTETVNEVDNADTFSENIPTAPPVQ